MSYCGHLLGMNFIKKYKFYWLLNILVITILLIFQLSQNQTNSQSNIQNFPVQRDKHQWPFSSDSIWNMPIGSEADYIPANLESAYSVAPEINYYIVATDQDPLVNWYSLQNWGVGRCELGGKLQGRIPVSHDLIVPDATTNSTPNNAAAFLQPDGRTLISINPLTRCQAGGPIFGYSGPKKENIYGQGITGGQGGSGLSSIGGTIRQGELLPTTAPIRHVLKLLIYAHKYLYSQPPGYRWPAIRSDAYAFDVDSKSRYGGNNPNLVMGSLLAIPPHIKEKSLSLKTIPGKKIFHALQDYGGYIVDDTAWDSYGIAMTEDAESEFQRTYNYSFGSNRKNPSSLYKDINKIFKVLHIVNNNSLETIGGGGIARQPLAPPIIN